MRALEPRRSRYLFAILVFLHLVAISRQVDAGNGSSLLERGIFTALAPLQRAATGGVLSVRGLWAAYVDLRGVHEENRRLRARLHQIESELQEQRHEASQAVRLREILDLQRALPVETVVAEVLARDAVPWFRTITLDKGRDDGVVLNAAVISATGVVGRVTDVGPRAAKVQLLLDPQAAIGVVTDRKRVTGVLNGPTTSEVSPAADLPMKYVSALADVVEGELVLTSGFDLIFPRGLVVGRVRVVGPSTGLFREVLVSPSARFDQLEEVLVVRTPPAAPVLDEAVR